jgi:uncharacterized peroxidase-related enzyme
MSLAALPSAYHILAEVENKLGFVPNLFKEMSVSPATLIAYLSTSETLSHGSLSPREQQAVQLTVSSVNGCHYCQAVHCTLGAKVGMKDEHLKEIRDDELPATDGLGAVVQAARLLMDKKGWLDADDLRSLEAQGITKAILYEIIAFIGLKTIANYIHHIVHTPVDKQFLAQCQRRRP